jgi:hypothetical protein
MTGEPITRHSRDGRLSLWADPVAVGAPGWQIATLNPLDRLGERVELGLAIVLT